MTKQRLELHMDDPVQLTARIPERSTMHPGRPHKRCIWIIQCNSDSTATTVGGHLQIAPPSRHSTDALVSAVCGGDRDHTNVRVVDCLSHNAHVANKGKMDLLTVVVDSPLSQPFVFFLLFSVFS